MTSPEWLAADEDDADRFPQTTDVSTTFTYQHSCGATVHVVDAKEQPHGCSNVPVPDPARVARYAELIGRLYLQTSGGGVHSIEDVAQAVVAVADGERAALVAEVERMRGRLDISERSVAEARGDNPSGFMSQREWEDWSNELAMILPEDAECWPGVNPEGAQESIIEAALRYLVAAEAKVAKVEEMAAEWEAHFSEFGIVNEWDAGASAVYTDLRVALADAPAEQRAEGGA